jgi:hypothetical protein
LGFGNSLCDAHREALANGKPGIPRRQLLHYFQQAAEGSVRMVSRLPAL